MKKKDLIVEKHKALFTALEEYDRSHTLPDDRQWVTVTLSRRTVQWLRQLKKKTGKSVSRLVEEAIREFA